MRRLWDKLGFGEKKKEPKQEIPLVEMPFSRARVNQGFDWFSEPKDPKRLKLPNKNWPPTKIKDGVTTVTLLGKEWEYPPIFMPETYSFSDPQFMKRLRDRKKARQEEKYSSDETEAGACALPESSVKVQITPRDNNQFLFARVYQPQPKRRWGGFSSRVASAAPPYMDSTKEEK